MIIISFEKLFSSKRFPLVLHIIISWFSYIWQNQTGGVLRVLESIGNPVFMLLVTWILTTFKDTRPDLENFDRISYL